jgi:RNA polymerase sigma factor (sigma-70 family)
MPEPDSAHAAQGQFTTTHWSVVLAAGHTSAPGATEALAKLCGAYWYPLYAYLRRSGRGIHDAQDLTQAFFARLIEKKDFALADREKGKFRFYLLGALKHFLADQHDKATALKRGGGRTFISFDAQTAEQRYHLEPVDEASPDKLFERRWALTLLDQALARLRLECAVPGKAQLYEELETFLTGAPGDASYGEIAARQGTTESAVKSALHRLRQRHRELIREEVAATVSTAAEVEEEIRHLIAVLARRSS